MAGSPRLNTISYGGETFGNGTSYELHDIHIDEQDYETLVCEWTVVYTAASASALQTLDQAVVDALRTPNGDLVVTLNGTATINTSHSSNTGFNARGSSSLIEYARADQSKARRCRVELTLPADESGKNFRRSSLTTIRTDDQGFVTLTVQAEYTAGGADSAQTNVSDNFATFVAAQRPSLAASMTWDTTDNTVVEFDEENKVARCSAVNRSILHNQSSGTLDNTDVVGAEYTLTTTRPASPQLAGSGAKELITVEVAFTWPVRVTESTDLDGLFTGTVLPYLEAMVSSDTDAPATPIENTETYTVNPDRNVLSGRVSFSVIESNLVFASKKVNDTVFFGDVLVPLADGGRWSKILHHGPGTWTRDVFLRTVEIGTRPGRHRQLLREAQKQAEKAGFRLMAKPSEASESTEVRTRRGLLTFTERATALLFEYWKPGKGAGGRLKSQARNKPKAFDEKQLTDGAQTTEAG